MDGPTRGTPTSPYPESACRCACLQSPHVLRVLVCSESKSTFCTDPIDKVWIFATEFMAPRSSSADAHMCHQLHAVHAHGPLGLSKRFFGRVLSLQAQASLACLSAFQLWSSALQPALQCADPAKAGFLSCPLRLHAFKSHESAGCRQQMAAPYLVQSS